MDRKTCSGRRKKEKETRKSKRGLIENERQKASNQCAK
jgi:hypothetical protein